MKNANQSLLNLEDIYQEYKSFIKNFKTLYIASCDKQGMPEASYAPFVIENEVYFYVYLSKLAKHSGNLQATKQASILFIQPEKEISQLFARQRVNFSCHVEIIERYSEHWQIILSEFQQQFGEIINVLYELKDFQLFCFKPYQGNYVRGFAQAYAITGDDLATIRHRNEKGHQR